MPGLRFWKKGKEGNKNADPLPKEDEAYTISLRLIDPDLQLEQRQQIANQITSDLQTISIGQETQKVPGIEGVTLENISTLEKDHAGNAYTLGRLYMAHLGLLANRQMKTNDVKKFEETFLNIAKRYAECAKSMGKPYVDYLRSFLDYQDYAMRTLAAYMKVKNKPAPAPIPASPAKK
jgi:hypothetical protein